MQRPPAGLCLPCRLHQVIAGDTIDVWITAGVAWRLQLIECFANSGAALEVARELLEASNDLHVLLPLVPEAREPGEPLGVSPLLNLLAPVRHRFVPAYLFLNDKQTLNEVLVKRKLATSKGGKDAVR